MKRREFLRHSVIAGAGLPMMSEWRLDRPAKWFEISLAQWSLHRAIRAGQIDHLDFARTARREFQINAVEYVNQFFPDKATDKAYLKQMKQRADDEDVRSLLIMIDAEGNLGDVDAAERTRAVENHFKWVDAARYLGCHSIRVNAYSQAQSPAEAMKLCADGLRRLAEYGAKQKINILIENHGGLSSNGAWARDLVRLVDHKRLGTLPDFGNFQLRSEPPEWYDRYQGVGEMMPFAKAVSAKSHDFDASGNETHTDFRRMLGIVKKHGYRGYVGVEYEGNVLSEFDGIRATRDLLIRVRDQLK